MVSFGRIDEILSEPEETDSPDAQQPPLDKDIVFDHVSFSYEEGNPVLKDISFTVKAGQTVAILGATGSGKSTLMKLLDRLYDLKGGDITIGGVSISQIKKSYLRSHVGFILQEPFLYSRSVRENIRLVKPDISEEEMFEATRTASAHEFIQSFERGYDTPVGERGVTLSGGQKAARGDCQNPAQG